MFEDQRWQSGKPLPPTTRVVEKLPDGQNIIYWVEGLPESLKMTEAQKAASDKDGKDPILEVMDVVKNIEKLVEETVKRMDDMEAHVYSQTDAGSNIGKAFSKFGA